MADSASGWLNFLQAIVESPEKGALLLVLMAGGWRWIRELWRESKDAGHHETLIEALMRQNKEFMHENKELREELRKKRVGEGDP